MNGFPMKIVGVAEPGFRGMDWSAAPAIWIPMMMRGRATQGDDQLLNRRYRILHGFGRLKPGVSREEAEARLAPWFKAYLQADTEREGWPQVTDQQMEEYMAAGLELRSGAQGLSRLGRVMRRPMLILLAATGLILLLACLNAANLSLARALSRRRATALRAALGASKGRLLTEQLIESGVLAGAGCLIGLALAPPTARAMLAFLPEQGALGVSLSADLDLGVLLFASCAAALTTLLSGAAPALHAASVRPAAAIKQQSNAVAGGLGLRKALVVGQFALALVLLIGAGLFSRTLGALRAQGPGYSTTNLAMFRLDPMSDGYSYEQTKPLVRRLLERVRTLPEVERAGVGLWGMLRGGGWNNFVTVEADQRIATEKSLPMNAVSPGFFETLGAPLTRGRNFDERDSRDDSEWGIRSAIVNEEFVAKYLVGSNLIGARLGFGNGPDAEANIEIVGVVASFHDFQLREPEAHIYFPAWERGLGGAVFYVRSRGSSEATMRSLRAAVREADPKLTIVSMRTVDDQLDRLLSSERMLATLASAFAALATLLASIGLYGVLSFSAERRTKEMGIRIALGAPQWAAGGLIVREAAWLALAGAMIALPASWALGRLVESQLFGVRPMDAATIAAAVAALTLVCLGASALPARRAGRADPLDALRSE